MVSSSYCSFSGKLLPELESPANVYYKHMGALHTPDPETKTQHTQRRITHKTTPVAARLKKKIRCNMGSSAYCFSSGKFLPELESPANVYYKQMGTLHTPQNRKTNHDAHSAVSPSSKNSWVSREKGKTTQLEKSSQQQIRWHSNTRMSSGTFALEGVSKVCGSACSTAVLMKQLKLSTHQ
jgi:hypothetical protein